MSTVAPDIEKSQFLGKTSQDEQLPPNLPSDPVRFLLFFLGHYWHALTAILVLETGQAACQIMIPYAVKGLIDQGAKFNGTFEQALVFLKPSVTLFVAVSLGILLFSRASGSLLVMVGPALRRRVRKSIYHYLQFHSQRFFISNFSGSLANRISEVSMGVNHSLWTILFDFWPLVVTFSTSIYLIYQSHNTVALVLAGWTFLYVAISFALATRCQTLSKKFAATRSTVSGKIVDAVTNSMNAKLFSKLDFERQYLSKFLDLEVQAARRTFWFMEIMRWFQFIAAMILQLLIVALSLKYWLAGEMTVGAFSMVAGMSMLLINDARGLSRRFLEFFEYMGNISDGVSMIVRPHEIIDRVSAKDIAVTKGEVVFQDVCFAYNEKAKIFDKLNVAIKPGEKVGLVGFSGSGKTTFTNLILRMYDVQSGQIAIDGQNIAEVTQDSLRAQIAMIPQEPMLFHRTLLENIRYGRAEASDEEVYAAAKMARAHDFIMNLPEGYAALVGERGVKLSGGQRQRVAIARAVLKNAPILILDEATSSLDSITEKHIQDALSELMKNKTVIVVAHRLSTISKLDRILVFQNGQIVEEGTHQALLNKEGHYFRLWNMQVGGFLPAHLEGKEVDDATLG